MSNLLIKDVQFDNSIIKAAQDENKAIWIGVRWLCDNLGFSLGQQNRQVNNIQKDLVLSQGISFITFPEGQRVLCLKLNYLPLWLAKVSITPAMRRTNPELVEKLIKYQVLARDVLAEAFIEKQYLDFTAISNQIQQMQSSIDLLYSDMGKMCNLVIGNKTPELPVIQTAGVDPYIIWRHNIFKQIDSKGMNRKNILNSIQLYMRKNYGIVWEQELRDYISRNANVGKVSNMDVIYDNSQYRSIFESVLRDTLEQTNDINAPICELDRIIRPLVEKNHDKSNRGMVTYKKVYAYMDKEYTCSWDYHEGKYIKEHGHKPKFKKELLEFSMPLRRKFESAVEAMLKE